MTKDSSTLSGHYDFRLNKKWSQFLGLQIASIGVEISNVDDSDISYGLALGVSYILSINYLEIYLIEIR